MPWLEAVSLVASLGSVKWTVRVIESADIFPEFSLLLLQHLEILSATVIDFFIKFLFTIVFYLLLCILFPVNFKCLNRGFYRLGKIELELFRAVDVLMFRTNRDRVTSMLVFSKAVWKQMHCLKKQNSCSDKCLELHTV